MPTLVVNHEDPADIRNSMALLAKLLPEETMFLVNTANETDIQQLITTLRGYLPPSAAFKAPEIIPPEWARYDERITAQTVLELIKTWPETSKSFSYIWEKNGCEKFNYLVGIFQDHQMIPCGNFLFKGHILHPEIHQWLTGYAKQGRFWRYVIEQWQLAPTPEGWIPPDMR